VVSHRCRDNAEEPSQAVNLDVTTAGPGGRVAVITVTGEIDLRTAQTVRAGLLDVADAGFRRIVVDFQSVRFCDATGLGALVAAHNRLRAEGGELRLAGVRAAQRRILRITGLDRLFTLHESVEDAVGEGRAPTTSPLG
jgi:anti-sigma B factor antagonist